MHFSNLVTAATVLAGLAAATPVPSLCNPSQGAQVLLTAGALESCAEQALFPEECRTAGQASPFVFQSFRQYNIRDVNEMAALISLMIFETGGFAFDRNHFPEPGRPGQGTRNLQMVEFNLLYALSIPSLRDQAQAIAAPDGGALPEDPQEDLSDEQKNEILALVLPDELSFASAAWFYSDQCTEEVREAVRTGTEEGWTSYIEDCVGTEVDEGRRDGWLLAREALGLGQLA